MAGKPADWSGAPRWQRHQVDCTEAYTISKEPISTTEHEAHIPLDIKTKKGTSSGNKNTQPFKRSELINVLRTSSLSGDRAIARERRKWKKLNEIQETATLIRTGYQKKEPETSLEVRPRTSTTGARLRSLVGELRSHRLHGMPPNKRNEPRLQMEQYEKNILRGKKCNCQNKTPNEDSNQQTVNCTKPH